jgi:hypothetical protein
MVQEQMKDMIELQKKIVDKLDQLSHGKTHWFYPAKEKGL